MIKCRACGAPITFIWSPEGKSISCDPVPVLYWSNPRAKGTAVTANGRFIRADFKGDPKLATGTGYKPHWASCPKRLHRRKR